MSTKTSSEMSVCGDCGVRVSDAGAGKAHR